MMNEEQVKDIILNEYDMKVDVKKLVGYADLNFLVSLDHSERFIFKVHQSDKFPHLLDAQNEFMRHISNAELSEIIPKMKKTLFGTYLISLQKYGFENSYGRLLNYIEGDLFKQSDASLKLINHLGRLCALVNKYSVNFSDHRFLLQSKDWTLDYAYEFKHYLKYVQIIPLKRLIHYYLDQYKYMLTNFSDELPRQIIHGDINDYNIIVSKDKVCGLIDFGDSCESFRISELAIALSYVLMNRKDVIEASCEFVKSYHSVNPLQEKELDVLYYFIAARLCTSLLNSYRNSEDNPDSDYHQISLLDAKKLLEKWETINPFNFSNQLKELCSFSVETRITDISERHEHFAKSYSISYDSPLYIEKAGLHYLYADDGKSYLDCVNNISHVGHCHPRINEAIYQQTHQLNTNTRYIYSILNTYITKLLKKFPKPLDVAFLTNSGSEAGDLAQRIAKTITQREDLIVLDHAYHGNTSAGIDVSAYKFNRKGGQGKKDHVHVLSMPDERRGKFADSKNMLEAHLSELDDLLGQLEKENRLPAAFYAETILGCGGQIFLPKNYLKEVFKRVRAKGILCILDEVQVGFGRVGSHFWAFETQDVIPDLVVIGKPMGNGHPIAGLITSNEVSVKFNNGMEFFSSFGGNPVSCAIGNEVLDIIEDEELQENAKIVGDYFLKNLSPLKEDFEIISDIRGMGLFIGIEYLINNKPAAKEVKTIVEAMKNNQILLSIDGPENNVIKIKPPIIFEKKHVDIVINKLYEIMEEMSF